MMARYFWKRNIGAAYQPRRLEIANDLVNSQVLFFHVFCQIRALFDRWLDLHEELPSYDIFLSYRWGPHDSALVAAIYDR
jgi:hypothetical protein